MKLRLEVESLDTSGLYGDVVRSLAGTILARGAYSADGIQAAVLSEVDRVISAKLNEALDATIAGILSKPIQKFDVFGNAVGEPTSVEQIVEHGAGVFLHQLVDNDGKPATGHTYGTKKTRIEWLIEKHVIQGLAKELEPHAKLARQEVTKRAAEAAAAVIAGVKA
jgi:hypothetical protein